MRKCGGSLMLSLAGNDTTYDLGSIFQLLHGEVHSTDLNGYEVDGGEARWLFQGDNIQKVRKERLDNEYHYFGKYSKVIIRYMHCLVNNEILLSQLRAESLPQFYRLSVFKKGS